MQWLRFFHRIILEGIDGIRRDWGVCPVPIRSLGSARSVFRQKKKCYDLYGGTRRHKGCTKTHLQHRKAPLRYELRPFVSLARVLLVVAWIREHNTASHRIASHTDAHMRSRCAPSQRVDFKLRSVVYVGFLLLMMLSVVVAAVDCCCCCCWLLLVVVVVGSCCCCCWLLLSVGCCWLVVVVAVAVGCCCCCCCCSRLLASSQKPS